MASSLSHDVLSWPHHLIRLLWVSTLLLNLMPAASIPVYSAPLAGPTRQTPDLDEPEAGDLTQSGYSLGGDAKNTLGDSTLITPTIPITPTGNTTPVTPTETMPDTAGLWTLDPGPGAVSPDLAPLTYYLPVMIRDPNVLPVADFSVDRSSGYAPLTIQFDNNSENAIGARWDFGDGTISSDWHASHNYSASGTYTVTLTVSNTVGSDSVTRSGAVVVNDSEIDFRIDSWAGTAPMTVTFSSLLTGTLGSVERQGQVDRVESYLWDFGDGTQVVMDSEEISVTHVYSQSGVYSVTLTAETLTRQLTKQKQKAIVTTDPNLVTMSLMTPQGGRISSADGRVFLDFAPSAIPEDLYISVDHIDMTDVTTDTVDGEPQMVLPPGTIPFHMIDLLAHNTDNLNVVDVNFSAPVTLTYLYSQSVGTQSIEDLIDVDSMHFGLFDEEAQAFIPLTNTVTTVTSPPGTATTPQLSTILSHFSTYGVTGDKANWVTPSIDAASVQMSRGSSSYGYPIPLPTGPGGFAPQIALQYSSGIVNGMMGDKNTDTGWVGLGWTLELGQIVKGESITLNSISGDLKKGDDNTYYLESDTSIHIEQIALNSPKPDGVEEINRDYAYHATTKDGNTYVFGQDTGQDGLPIGSILSTRKRKNGECRHYNEVFKLAKVIDIHGNTLEIQYTELPGETKCGGEERSPVRESYPEEIRYTFNPNAGDNHAEYVVRFDIESKGYNAFAEAKTGDGSRKLMAIHLYYLPTGVQPPPLAQRPGEGWGGVLIRTLDFTYDTNVAARTNRLTELEIIGSDGTSTLPATTFSYEPHEIRWRRPYQGDMACGPNTSNPSCYRGVRTGRHIRHFLSKIENGYGGEVGFEYTHEAGSQAQTDIGEGLFMLTTSRTLTDTVTGLVSTQRYDYHNPNLIWQRNNGRKVILSYGRFYGFGVAYQVDPLGRWSQHNYNNQKDHILNGYSLASWTYDNHPSIGNYLSASQPTYMTQRWPVPRNDELDDGDEGVRFVHLAEQINYQCEPPSSAQPPAPNTQDLSLCMALRTTSTVDAWGNRISETVFDANNNLFRRVAHTFVQHPTKWLFRTATEEVFDKDDKRISLTWSSYDGQPNAPAQVLTDRPLLTHQRVWDEDESGFIDVAISEYDAYGNPKVQTAFNSYGSESAFAAGEPRATSTTYGPHGIFPIEVRNPLQHLVTTQYDYRFQQPTQVIDPNGAVTKTEFDPWGRTLNVTLPPAGECGGAYPDFIATYGDNAGQPYFEQAQQRIDDCTGPPIYATTTVLYDGLGRKIQAHTPGDTEDEWIVTDVAFDDVGRLTHTSVPYLTESALVSAGPRPNYLPPDWNTLDQTVTTYDRQNRPTEVLAPDKSKTTSSYALATAAGDTSINRTLTTVIDPNGHSKTQVSDEFGRLVEMQEYTGALTDPEDRTKPERFDELFTLYATTVYTYDTRDNLVGVMDAKKNRTVIDYNFLNRKEGMTDPDMGTWRYLYDALGNLRFQTDANGTTTTLEYDLLNRLTNKSYAPSANVAQTPAVTYGYDGGNNGIGRLTHMDDGVGGMGYTYDPRGRILTQSRTFSGNYATLANNQDNGAYITSYVYDAADRILTTTYPDGEAVATDYTLRGLPLTLRSTIDGTNLIQQTSYNHLGQMTNRLAGNGIATAYDYYSTQNQNNRLKTIRVGDGLMQSEYDYDSVGNITQIVDTASSFGGQTLTFSYDHLDRLTDAEASQPLLIGTETSDVPQAYKRSYTYDEIGNITSRTLLGTEPDASEADNLVQTYGYKPRDKPHAVRSVNDDTYDYDPNGNMRTRTEDGITYTQGWNTYNKLAQVSWQDANGDSYTTRFVYDGDGNRLLRIEDKPHPLPNNAAQLQLTTVYIGQLFEKQFNTTDTRLAVVSEQLSMVDGPIFGTTQPSTIHHPPSTAQLSRPPGLAAPLLISYSDAATVNNSQLPNANVWPLEQKNGGTATVSGNRLRIQRSLQNETVWSSVATLESTARVNIGNPAGTSFTWRFALEPGNAQTIFYLRLEDPDANRRVELECSIAESTGPITCIFGLEKNNNSSVQLGTAFNTHPGTGTLLTAGTIYTVEIRVTGTRTAALYIDGALQESLTFTDAQWNNLNWVIPLFKVLPINGQTTLVDVSLYQLGYSNATDNAAPTITLGGAAQNTWLGETSSVTMSAMDGSTVYDGSGVKCVKAQWDTPISGDDGGCYTTSLSPMSVNQQGSHTLYVKAWDWAGNSREEQALYQLDTVPPTLSGTANPGCIATSNVWQSTCDNPSFTWNDANDSASGIANYLVYWGPNADGTPTETTNSASFDPGPVTSDSTTYLRAIAIDSAGNQSTPATFFIFKHDGSAPAVPTMNPEDAYTPGTNNQLFWNGISESNVEYRARRASNVACSVGTVDSGWISSTSHQFTGLADGVTYYYCIQSRDSLGNESTWSSSVSSTQDASPPGIPVITAEPDFTIGNSNNIAWGAVADGGVGNVQYQIRYADNDSFSEATTSSWQGSTSFTANTLINCTEYFYQIRAKDGLENISSWSGVESSTQDASPPTGTIQIDGGNTWTTVGQVSLVITASDDCATTSQLQMRLQNEDGNWSAWGPFEAAKNWNLTAGDGAKTITVQFQDGANNVSTGTIQDAITVDATEPVAPNPTVSNVLFSPNGDNSQDDTTISATIVEANAVNWTIEIQDPSGTVIRSQSGTGTAVNWTWDGKDNGGTTVVDGSGYSMRIQATDAAGNSETSASTSLQIDTVPPVLSLTHPVEGGSWPVNETIPTNQNVLLVEGNVGTPSDTVTVNTQAATVSGATNAFAQNATLTVGANVITVIATDTAGNRTTATRNVIFDESAPTLSSHSPTAQGPNNATQDNAPLISGTFENAGVADGSGVAVDIDEVRVLRPGGVDVTAFSTVTVDGFAYAPDPPLLEGLNTVRVEMKDEAGNFGAYEWSFEVDRSTSVQIQQPQTGSVLNDVNQAVSGTGEPNANLSLSVNGTPSGNTTVDANGNFAFPVQTLADNDTSSLIVSALDSLGNTAVTTSTVMVNSSQPGASVNVAPNPFSDETHFGLSASAPISASVGSWSLIVGTESITQNIGLPPASWTWDGVVPEPAEGSGPIADGAYAVTLIVTATNNASTTATIATAPDLIRDTTSPAAPVIRFPLSGATNIEPSTLVTGTAEPNAAVTIFNNGLFTFTAAADASGLWQLVYPLEGGLNTLTATATDLAGHESAPSIPVTVQVVVEPPLIDVGLNPGMAGPNALVDLEALSRGAGHTDGPPTASVNVTVPDPATGTSILNLTETTPGTTGLWTLDPGPWTIDPGLAFGPYVLTFEGIDTVGLVGQGKSSLFVDPVPPNPPFLDHPVGDVLVNLTQIPMVGKADPLDTIVISINGTQVPTLTVQADAHGNWEMLIPLVEGLNTIQVNARDLVGNNSTSGPVARITRDTVPPEISGRAVETPIQTGPDLYFRANITDTSAVGLASVQVAGGTLPLIDFGTFWERVRLGDLAEGIYSLVFFAQDAATNTNTTTNTLTIDNTPPVVNRSLALQDTTNARIISDTVWFGTAPNQLTISVATTDTLAGLSTLDFGPATLDPGSSFGYTGESTATESHDYPIGSEEALGTTIVITATDLADNDGYAPPTQLLRDVVLPTIPIFYLATDATLTLLDDNTTLVYGPQTSGSLTLTLQTRDTGIGLGQIDFPNIGFAGVDGGQQAGNGITDLTEFSHVYAIDGTQNVSGTFVVTVTDWVNNSNVVTFTVIRDDTPPEIIGEAVRPFIQSGNDLTFDAWITDTYPIAGATVAIDGTSVHDLLDVGSRWTATRPGTLSEAVYGLTFSATDQLGNTATATNTLVVADTDPTVLLDVTTTEPFGEVISNTMYFGHGDGTYTVTAQVSTPLADLDTVEFGDATSAGRIDSLGGLPSVTLAHKYTFTTASIYSSTLTITATDRAANTTVSGIAIIEDEDGPAVEVSAQSSGLDITVSWSAADESSGLESCSLRVEVDGVSTELSTECAGEIVYPGVQDVAHVFKLTVFDKVSNESNASASVTPDSATKYYYLGADRVAMRNGNGVLYLHGDHLGSTILVTTNSGQIASEKRYYPYGEERFKDGNQATDISFTGQRIEFGFDLMDYQARYYSPRLGKFISPDTIIPEPTFSQDWNRYMMVRGNPLKYTDPTGNTIPVNQLTCFWCGSESYTYGSDESTLIVDKAQDIVRWLECTFIFGCSVDTNTNTVTPPTQEEWAQAQSHNIIGMGLVPLGTVTLATNRASRRLVQHGDELLGLSTVPRHVLDNALKGANNRTLTSSAGNVVTLTKERLGHILTRHHPTFWGAWQHIGRPFRSRNSAFDAVLDVEDVIGLLQETLKAPGELLSGGGYRHVQEVGGKWYSAVVDGDGLIQNFVPCPVAGCQ
ncbi:MAG: PKD domain-containing protein [Chloroflexota bacterium]